MGRRKLPLTIMKEAIDSRNIEDFCWACLEQARLDMNLPEEDKVFSTTHTMSLVRQIVQLQQLTKTDPAAAEEKAKELNAWLSKPQPQVTKSL